MPPRVAHDLFDYAGGIQLEAPSDPKIVAKIECDIDAVIERIRPLDSDSKLTLARRMMKGLNSTSRLFNAALFNADKEEQPQDAELPLTPVVTEEDPIW